MAEHEKYKVETEYTVEDHASGPANRMERAFKALKHEAHKLGEKFHEFRNEQRFTAAAMLGVGFGLGAWVEKMKEAVFEAGKAKKALAGFFSESLNWPTSISGVDRYRHSAHLAAEMTEELEEVVANYGGSLDEASAGFRGLSAAVASAHLKPRQLMELYEQVAATAKATSTDVGSAAELVGRAIMTGSVRPVGVLGKELYQTLHAHGKLTKAMGVQGRMGLVAAMMKGQKPIADEMSKGIGDSMRKIQHSVEQMFQHVGTPIFGAIAKELDGWAKSITKAEKGAKPLAEAFGEKLVKAFHTAKEITGWLVDHWKEIAAIWAGFKLAGMAGGASGFLTKVSDLIGGNVGAAMGSFGKGLGAATAKLGLFAAAVGAAYMAGQALGEFLAAKSNKRDEIKGHGAEMVGATKILSSLAAQNGPLTSQHDKFAAKALKDLADSGVVNQGKVDRGAIRANLERLDDFNRKRLSETLGLGNLALSGQGINRFTDALAARLEPLLATFQGAHKKAEGATEVDVENLKTKGVQIGPFTGAINITQKFDDVDPDKIWIGTRRGIQENAERAVQSMHANPWGE